MSKKLLVLGASRYYKKSIEALKSYGYKVFTIDINANSPGFSVADGYSVIDITDKKKAYEYAKRINIDGVIPINDFGIQTAAYINDKLNLNGIRPNIAEIVTNKAKMRLAWEKNGAPIPKFFVSDSVSDSLNKIDKLRFPIIVKPADSRGGGSRGVKVVFDKSDFVDAFYFAQSFYEDKNVIIEECVQGSEHSIEVIVINSKVYILAISEKVKTPYPYRVDKQVIYPATLTQEQKNIIFNAVQKAIEGIGLENGVAHIELALTKQGPILFEIGARPGGGATPQIVEYVTGIEYLKLNAKIATGEKITENELKPKLCKSAIYHFFTFKPTNSRIKKINGIDKIKRNEYIKDFELFIKENDIIKEVKTGKDRQGFAIIVSNTKKEAIKYADLVEESITDLTHKTILMYNTK